MSRGELFVVDDNPDNLNLLSSLLREAGYHVRVAPNGNRALGAIRGHLPELILLDVNMPGIDGYEVCRQLKAEPRTADVPVIFLSARDDVRDKVDAFRAGGVDYVTKPFHAEEVLARVDTQLKLARLRQALEQKNRELEARQRELSQAWAQADGIFSALADALAGTVLDERFRLEQRIGVGGFAAVYRAVDLRTGHKVAVKVLRPHHGADGERRRRRFAREGQTALRVEHPHAVAVLDSGTTAAGISYLVMELLEGRTLGEELAASAPLPVERAVAIGLPVCGVLAEAHRAGVVHRDVKPANLFLHQSAGGEVVKVVDFGIARVEDDDDAALLTTAGRVLGTPVYMSPERLLGREHDGRADVYALAMCLYEALTGRLPFATEGVALGDLIMTCIHVEAPPIRTIRADVPAWLEALLARGLAKSPDDRPDAAGFGAALAAGGADRPDAAGASDLAATLDIAPPRRA